MNKCILDYRRKGGCASCSNEFCSHRIAMHGLNGAGGRVGAAGAPSDYKYLTLANSPARDGMEALYEVLGKYIKTFGRYFDVDGERIKSFYFYSKNPGTGKTTTAVALMNEFIMSNYLYALSRGEQPMQLPAMYLDMVELQNDYNLATMTNSDEELVAIKEKLRRASRVPFLVMDDVGTRSATESFRNLIHGVINHRATNSLPTVYTSNVPLDEFIRIFDARIYDRARDKCQEIKFSGESKRGK